MTGSKIARSACAALTLAFTGLLAGQAPTSPRACADWSPRVDLWVSPRETGTLGPRWLTLLPGHDRVFAAASILSVPGDPSWDFLVQEIGKDSLPLPPGGCFYLAPAGALDREGVLHLIWAEPDPAAGLEIFQGEVEYSIRRLLYASYRDGRWSPAEQIYEAQALASYADHHSDLVADEAGTLHFVFASGFSLVHLRREQRGWHARELRAPDGPGIVPGAGGVYPSLIPGPGSRLSLGVVSGAVDRAMPGD